ncbi:hypothetical protein [Dasychira pudibunda nucleopolyhedrovirus]|nr:hypothetical protein [Dasychira pudibunda nucleopolyhedrovirus]
METSNSLSVKTRNFVAQLINDENLSLSSFAAVDNAMFEVMVALFRRKHPDLNSSKAVQDFQRIFMHFACISCFSRIVYENDVEETDVAENSDGNVFNPTLGGYTVCNACINNI